ncbi:hypothetical protein LXL04_004932 [Taraxacum kok-saghyz]
MTDMTYMARRPYSSTLGSLAHATVSMIFYGKDLKISNTGMEHLIIIHTQPRAINHLSVPRRGGQPNSAIIVHNVPQEYGHSHGD